MRTEAARSRDGGGSRGRARAPEWARPRAGWGLLFGPREERGAAASGAEPSWGHVVHPGAAGDGRRAKSRDPQAPPGGEPDSGLQHRRRHRPGPDPESLLGGQNGQGHLCHKSDGRWPSRNCGASDRRQNNAGERVGHDDGHPRPSPQEADQAERGSGPAPGDQTLATEGRPAVHDVLTALLGRDEELGRGTGKDIDHSSPANRRQILWVDATTCQKNPSAEAALPAPSLNKCALCVHRGGCDVVGTTVLSLRRVFFLVAQLDHCPSSPLKHSRHPVETLLGKMKPTQGVSLLPLVR